MMATEVRQVGLILLLSLIPALWSSAFHPRRPSWKVDELKPGEVRLAQALSWGDSVLWVDARSKKSFEEGHIPEAVLLHEEEWGQEIFVLMSRWKSGKRVVVYCDSRECQASHQVAERLRKTGLTSVYVLHGGWEAWERHRH